MQVRTIIGAGHAYACISGPTFSLDVQLQGGMGAPKSLRLSAAEIREECARKLERAARMETAADILETEGA